MKNRSEKRGNREDVENGRVYGYYRSLILYCENHIVVPTVQPLLIFLHMTANLSLHQKWEKRIISALKWVMVRYGVKDESNNVLNRIGKLSLIDLACLERAIATDQRALRSLEGANINRSLLALISCWENRL
ncbi:kinesin-like protein KIN-8A [Tanacetum coccineum]|uniref:Kinesin-like protein KIN-8A n=1 Tax=Tanacetum coccineum TaxID=301880 RepID=A0ABQ5C6B4_9ASTR